ncbi:MAG TPA: single-stranded-DNA-specific exonuclease RecJ [Candidatus Limnocylindrales bacterium]|nr:single-stranded-DNA-specific exonuclease RecJ [Candidatus Limnocylindrales bacterium]
MRIKLPKQWVIPRIDQGKLEFFSKELRISSILASILLNRGLETLEAASDFLEPSLTNLHNPFLMKDMDKAVTCLQRALQDKSLIMIHGDYDVDGITGTALLVRVFRELYANYSYYIPQRLKEGYGLSCETIQKAKQQGVKVIITVDCGISACKEVELANELGIQVLITDHHQAPPVLPKATAILNPRQKECLYPFKSLAGVGIAYKLSVALMSSLGIPPSEEIPPYNCLDLVALGTIADVAPLLGENRILVKYGLKQISRSKKPGVIELKRVAGLEEEEIQSRHIGYSLAPRINAIGRLGNASEAVELLTTDNYRLAFEIAGHLDRANRERQEVEQNVLDEAFAKIETEHHLDQGNILVLSSPNWHPGVIGIAASKIVEVYYRPTVLIAEFNGIGRGSARSIPSFSIFEALRECACLLKNFGGHMTAAGLTIETSAISSFRDQINKIGAGKLSREDLIPQIKIDAEVDLDCITLQLIKELEKCAPFGLGNPEPVFVARGLQIMRSPCIVGENHLKMKVRQSITQTPAEAIGFGMKSLLEKVFPSLPRIDVVFSPQINNRNGKPRIQLRLKDIKF